MQYKTVSTTLSVDFVMEEKMDTAKKSELVNMRNGRNKKSVPLNQKFLLTLEEAAQYTGLGQQKLRDISSDEDCKFVLWNGSKRMLKRTKLEEYLNTLYSI